MRVIVFGAGAVGSTLGGLLALKHHDILLICRKQHAEAIREQNGLRMKSGTGEYFASLRAEEKLRAGEFKEDTCILFTPKSNDTERCVEQLTKVAPKDIPLVSFQNGVSNEEVISSMFSNVYGGVNKMTCSFLQPGSTSFRRLGRVIIGRYPKGSDAFVRRIAGIFKEAGFQAAVSRNIVCDKWLKLVVNLQSTVHAVIDGRDHDSADFVALKVGLLEEAERILRACKIKAKSCDGKDLSIDEMISELKKPRARRGVSAVKVNNSTWQNLYLKRKDIENAFFHGPIIEFGRRYNVPVPFNEVTLDMVKKCHKEKLGPQVLRASDVLEADNARIIEK